MQTFSLSFGRERNDPPVFTFRHEADGCTTPWENTGANLAFKNAVKYGDYSGSNQPNQHRVIRFGMGFKVLEIHLHKDWKRKKITKV